MDGAPGDARCCLCGESDISTTLQLPPRALDEMKHGSEAAAGAVVDRVTIGFCEDDWPVVRDLVLEMNMSPLPRCDAQNVVFETLQDGNSESRDDAGRAELEAAMQTAAAATLTSDDASAHARVQASVVQWALADREPTRE